MGDETYQGKTSRGTVILGMLVTFLGGYILGSMNTSPVEKSKAVKRAMNATRKSVPVDFSPVQGTNDALVTIVEFADFQCPFCAKSVPVRKRFMEAYAGKIRWVFKNHPLSFHPLAMPAAQASLAAQNQGKFWQYAERVFMNQKQLSEKTLVDIARDIGLNLDKFREDLKNKTYERPVKADLALARQVNVQGTPHYFINGRSIDEGMNIEVFDNIIREELAYAKYLMQSGVPRADLYQEIIKRYEKEHPVKVKPPLQKMTDAPTVGKNTSHSETPSITKQAVKVKIQ